MNAWTKFRLLSGVVKFRLTWNRRNTHYRTLVPDNPKFMGPRDAVGLINDGDVVGVSGLGGNQHATIIYWAIKELFEETGRPKDLTLLAIGGQGGRGIAPGTIDELGMEGLCKRFITGHFETFHKILALAEEGKVELQCLPQGTLALLIDAQGRGEDSVSVPTGVGTFVDPRVGRGTPVAGEGAGQWVEPDNGNLRYRIPKIDVAIFNAPAADKHGNIYMKDCSMIAEIPQLTRAVKRNGGKVIANVGLVVEEGYDDILVEADQIDAVVHYPNTGQSGGRSYKNAWSLVTTKSDVALEEGYAQMRYINRTLGLSPKRGPVDSAMARLAASTFAEHAYKGALVNIGTGLPEEVCYEVFKGGLLKDITFFTESGVIGGIPGPGAFFGAAACPERMVSSVEMFQIAHADLDVTMLGTLEVDSEGNVNVSKRGEGPRNYVGPGGFIDFSTSAKLVLFIGAWMTRAEIVLEDGKIRIVKPGKPKFVEMVDEITFSGTEAVKAGRKVFYTTTVGLFQLTGRGVELVKVMPGIDIQKDIIGFAPAKILLPESGDVPIVDRSIMTGEGFCLKLEASKAEKTNSVNTESAATS